MGKISALMLTLFILFLLFIFKSAGAKEIISRKSRDELKILSWNIYMLPHCSLFHGNCKRARDIAEVLLHSEYDIIVFQEAFDYRARRILRKQLRETFPYFYGPANESFFSFKTNSGLWIVSRIALVHIKEIEYQNRIGIDAMARKGAVMFEGNWNGNAFQLVSTHLQADSPDDVRHKQCDEIYDRLLKCFYKPNVPQIVCGDFNIEEEDVTNYQYMLHVLDAENGAIEGNILSTYDEIDNSLARKPNGKKRLIDYVLVRNSKIIREIKRKISVIRKSEKEDLSDHYGMEAFFSFSKVANGYAIVSK